MTRTLMKFVAAGVLFGGTAVSAAGLAWYLWSWEEHRMAAALVASISGFLWSLVLGFFLLDHCA